MYDSAVGKMILSALFWSVSTASDRYSGIFCHTGTAYSKTGLIIVKYTFKIFDGSTLALHNTLNEYNFLVAFLVMYSTWLFQLRSLLIIPPKIL